MLLRALFARRSIYNGGVLTKTCLPARQALRIMKLTAIILLTAALQVSANGFGQQITLDVKNMPLEKVFTEIENQSGYQFFYKASLVSQFKNVDLRISNATIGEALKQVLKNHSLAYNVVGKTVVITMAEQTVSNNIPQAPPLSIVVKGRITDENGAPVIATIIVKGTKNGTSTNAEGYFELKDVDENATLIITGVNIEKEEVKVNSRVTINVTARIRVNEGEEVVVAYGRQKQQAITGSVTIIKGEQIQNLPNRSFDKSLQGLVPGLLVTSGTGQPGGGLSNFVLRGIATGQDPTTGSTVRNPLIVIDGIPVYQDHNQWLTSLSSTPIINPMAQLNPSDIESITVLKDAAAISLYGSKASNGVILVTTKRGKTGKTVFNFRHQTDFSTRLKGKIELLNQSEYLELLYETYRNTNPAFWTDFRIDSVLKRNFPTRADGSLYPFTNWEDDIYTKTASTISNEISMSGGNDKVNFYLGLEYTKQMGVVKETGYDRKSIRFNFENRPTKWFKLGVNAALSYNIQDYASLLGDFPTGIATVNAPLNPIRLENGSYLLNFTYPFQSANPVAANEYNTNRNTTFRGLSKVFTEFSFLKWFKFSSSLGTDFILTEAKEKFDPRLYDATSSSVGSGRIQERDTRNANLITSNILRFDKTISGDHVVNILAGQEAQILTNKHLQAIGTNLQFSSSSQINSANTKVSSGSFFRQTLLSYFAQANYGYRSKYLLTSSIRTDGSSSFGEKNRFGTYWSVGAGWIVSEESFLKPASGWLNYLKLRGSIGAAGNSFAIDKYTRYDLLFTGNYLGGMAVYTNQPSNPTIKWENTFTWDIGAEARFWANRASLTIDIYKRKTSDLVYRTNLPFSSGFISVLNNIGNIENKGVEISFTADLIKSTHFKWNFGGNWSTNKNILVKANVPLATIGGTTLANEEGRNFNSFYLIEWAGVNSTDGTPMWTDSTGKPNSNRNAAKRSFVGKPQPDGFGSITNSLTYKNFQLSFLFYYQYGFKVYNAFELINDGFSPYMNQDKMALDRWRSPGDNASYPQRKLNNATGLGNSTRFLFDGDYLRLQNVSISYDLPAKLLSRVKISSFKLYAQAYNLAVWTKYPGGDIANTNAIGGMTFSYPNQRSYSLGANITF